jgi:hypothetical protein
MAKDLASIIGLALRQDDADIYPNIGDNFSHSVFTVLPLDSSLTTEPGALK